MSKAKAAHAPDDAPTRANLSALGGGGFARDARFVPLGGMTLPEDGPVPYTAFLAPGARPKPAPEPEPEPATLSDPIEGARAAAYAQGHADGRAEAEAESLQRDAIRARFAFAFDKVDAQCAEELRRRLMDTIVALCEATLRPLALDRDALAHRVERAVAMFARADDERVIRLNPQDLAAVQPLLPAEWVFAPDPALEPGAIRVETRSRGADGGGVEDGPAQWRRAIAEALDLGDGAC